MMRLPPCLDARARRALLVSCAALVIAACQSPGGKATHTAGGKEGDLAFVQGACGGCHAVERHGQSPNSAAPAFAAIVNQAGLTRETLSSWLRDAHNYPQEMEFYLEPAEVDRLTSYMLDLRDDAYRPPI